jgi:hypothetical protein
MKKLIAFTLISGMVLVSLIFTFARPPHLRPMNRGLDTPMIRFLTMDCPDSAESEKIHSDLLKAGAVADAFFIRIVNQGPGKKILEGETKSAKKQFEIRNQFLSKPGRKITIEKDGETRDWKTGDETETDYVSRKVNAFILRIRYRALEGLKLTGSPEAMAFLKSKAEDEKFPMQGELKILLQN